MRAKLSIIQFAHSVGHVFFAYKLHHSSAITIHVSITYIACLSHVILQVLPASTGRKTWQEKRWHKTHKWKLYSLGKEISRTCSQRNTSPTWHNNPVLRASGRRTIPPPRGSSLCSTTSTTTSASSSSSTSRKLHTQAVAIVVITITSVNSILSIPVKYNSYQSSFQLY